MPTKLPTRQLGKNGPQVTALGFGALGLSIFYGKPLPDEERFAILDRAVEIGQVNWDTADVYGDNETMIGEWFKRTGKRDEVPKVSSHKGMSLCTDSDHRSSWRRNLATSGFLMEARASETTRNT